MSTNRQAYDPSSINGHVGADDEHRLAAGSTALDALSQLATITESITRSTRPAEVFDALGAACAAAFAGECLVELVEDSGEPYRLSWPKTALRVVSDGPGDRPGTDRSSASAIVKELLYGARPTLIDGNTVAAVIVGNGPVGGGYLGAVVCTRAAGFTAADSEILRMAVHHCVAIIRQERLHAAGVDTLATKIANLEVALASNREIGVAVGVLGTNLVCTSEEAFALLRQASQDTNRKLRDIAAEVVRTGVLNADQTAE